MDESGVDINEFIEKRDELKEAKSKLLSVYLSPKSRMNEDDYINTDNELHDQIEALDAQIYEIQANSSAIISVEDIKQYLHNLKNEVATTEEMRALVMAVVDTVAVDSKAKEVELFFKVYSPNNYVSKGAKGKPKHTLYQIEDMEFIKYENNIILGVIKTKLPKVGRTSWKQAE